MGTMMTFLVLVLAVLFVKLGIIASIRPVRSHFSLFELERRAAIGDPEAIRALRREQLLPSVVSLLRVLTALIVVAVVAISIATFGWTLGILVSIVVAFEHSALARIKTVSRWGERLYAAYEVHLLHFVERWTSVIWFIRGKAPTPFNPKLSSKAELSHLVEGAGTVLSADERKLIINSMDFESRRVSEVMTPRAAIDYISSREHLGPLTLDELHKKGHSRFPVVDADIDHVVGMLHIQDLLTIDAHRKSTSVEKAMEPRVFYIKDTQTLQHALAAFLRTHHHLFVVINEFHETVGLVSLEDVIEALLGRKIVDEFDAHEDMRVVAARNPHHNNDSKDAINV